MKKTILSIAVIAAAFVAASCQKENLQENTAPEGNASIFTATIETGADTKTTVERVTSPSVAYKTKWENTDKISINGVTYTATPDATDATKATFTKDSGDAPTGPFNAYFPANMYSDSKAILPASYTYTDGKYNMPMYAQSSTTSLPFKNLCGVLAITVNGTDFTSVEKIEVFSDKQMNGEFTATADGVLIFASATLTDDNKKVALTFNTAKSIASDGSATFYIPVPAGTHNPLAIKVTGGSTPKVMVTKKSGGVAVVRNSVYPIAFNGQPITGTAKRKGDIDVNWVQLWAGGPKFAEYNVGVTDCKAESYGVNCTWANNIASSEWGSNWRMPTKEELENLLSNCTVVWTKTTDGGNHGRKFTGKGAYASNSVFLPAAGYYSKGSPYMERDSHGCYWSSTPGVSLGAYYLDFKWNDQNVNEGHYLLYCYSVRAVLEED